MPIISEAIKQQILDCTQLCCEHASAFLKVPIEPPTIGFRRSGGNAGTAHLQRNHINLNPIFINDNLSEYLNQVIPHEIAHLVVYQCFGKVKPHGKEWQAVMRDIFDCDPLVRHSMQMPQNAQRSFNYECRCGPTTLTIRRHNQVIRGKQQYQCRRCLDILVAAE